MFLAAGIEILCIYYCPETRAKIRRHLCCCCCCGCKRSTRRRPPPNSAKREDPEDPPDDENANRKGTVLLFNSMLRGGPTEALFNSMLRDSPSEALFNSMLRDRPTEARKLRDTVMSRYMSRVGRPTNDLPGRLEADGTTADYRGPLQEGRSFSNNAVVPSVYPRTVTDHADLMPKLDSVSVGGLDLATGKDFVFIDYDSQFHTRDGGINDAALGGDGLHVSKYQTNKLGLKTTDVDITKSNRLSDPTRVSRPTRRQEERPSNHMHQNDRRNRSTLADRTENARDSTSVHSACYKCGLYDHTTDGCRHRFRVKCKKCGQLGHKSYSTMCQWSESDS